MPGSRRTSCRLTILSAFVEGDEIGQGIADVIVVEGFACNIALKTAEGTAKQMAAWMRGVHGLPLRPARRFLADKGLARPQGPHGPAPLQRRAVPGPQRYRDQECYGGTDAFGFASAIEVGYQMAEAT